jgi:hypothetical protein
MISRGTPNPVPVSSIESRFKAQEICPLLLPRGTIGIDGVRDLAHRPPVCIVKLTVMPITPFRRATWSQ